MSNKINPSISPTRTYMCVCMYCMYTCTCMAYVIKSILQKCPFYKIRSRIIKITTHNKVEGGLNSYDI